MYTFLIVLLLLLSLLLYLGFKAIFENKHDRRNALNLKVALDRVIRRNRLLISEIDTFGNKIIALDRKNNKIILVEHINNVIWEKCLSLGELESCIISKEMNKLTGCTQKVVIFFCIIRCRKCSAVSKRPENGFGSNWKKCSSASH